MDAGSALASILAPAATGYIAMLWGWSVAMYLASALAIVSVAILFFTAPKSA
jgi:predicted MFS family arabinose efflux permease